MIRLKRLYAHDFKQLSEVEIRFPAAGRILVQGRNEAGKSTLFEAIFFALFGQALATESAGKPNLDDLIGYEKSKARVELDLAVGERVFRIIRTLNRGRANVWQLEIENGGRTEEIRGNRAVNDRLVSELGFDSEALLNTCFVEQKKLEKLEGLNKAKREESLSKLLNLERLLEIEDQLKLHVEDEKTLARLVKRVELAQTQEQLPAAEEDLTRAEGELKLMELAVQVARAAEERRAAAALRENLTTMQARREELRGSLGRIDELDKARRAMVTTLDRYDLLEQHRNALAALRRERDETESAARERLPGLRKRSRELGFLVRQLNRVNQVDAVRGSALGDLQRAQEARQQLDSYLQRGRDLNIAITELEARAEQLDRMLRSYEVGEALGKWAAAAREAQQQGNLAAIEAAKQQERDRAQARLRAGLIAPGAVLAALVAATFFVPLALFLATGSALLSVGAGGILLAADAALGFAVLKRALSAWHELDRATEELGKVQGEAQARQEIATTIVERLEAAQARLKELGAEIPATPEGAEAGRVAIAATLENKTRDEIHSERDQVRDKLNYARAQRDEVVRQIQNLEPIAASVDAARAQAIIAKAEKILKRWGPPLARQAAALQIANEYHTIREARQAVESEIKNWEARLEQARQLEAKIADTQARMDKQVAELRAVYELSRAVSSDGVPAWDSSLPRTAYFELGKKLSDEYKALGGDQVRARLTALEREIGACESELKMRDKASAQALDLSRSITKDLGMEELLDAAPTIEQLEELTAKLKSMQRGDKAQLEKRVRSLHQQVGALRDTQNRLERELGLQGETVSLQAAQEEMQKERLAQEERKQGAEIVMRARKRIVQKVLPATMDYMRRILPQLTRDRYHDAELDPETYKIRVWDERAGQSGAWKEKNIFSGGTKDQFSLALRLAFALATLPQERGTSPGFIFLDEPLGSFDDERASALLYLLTEGEIGRAFDQIFLISHVKVDEARFTHHLRLENGVVVESNLNGET